ncbi:MAG: hypothetical protein QOD63_815 [Actinomycetota bacterium]|nr:hypothetical protein [Actinomycetota bacterium]
MRDDHVLAPTRWVSAAVVPVLVAAFVILYVFPSRTERLWGWTIHPEMSALIMGAGYVSGAYFFVRAATVREWHRVGVGFVATTVFASMLMVTTLLHWDRFNHDHVSFWAWILLYFSTPFLLPWLWATNRRTDPGGVSAGDVTVPRPLRVAIGTVGAAVLAFAAVMFVKPSVVIDIWPWTLTPPTARSVSAFLAFPAVTWLLFLFDDRWSSFRITQQTAGLGMFLIGLGAIRARDEFAGGADVAFYVGALAVALGFVVILQVAMDRRARRVVVSG